MFCNRRYRDILAHLVTHLWRMAFASVRWLASPTQTWNSAGGQRVLVIAPHPDDEVCGCAGVIALHRQAGDEVSVACITDGRLSRALNLTPSVMAERRHAEFDSAASVLGVTHSLWVGLPEGNWSSAQLSPVLRDLFITYAPDICYAPSRVDFHPEHWQVAEALAQTLPAELTLRIYPVQVPLLFGLVNLVADVSNQRTVIETAFAHYLTQANSIACALRQRRYAAAWYHRPVYAETFWELSAPTYRHWHAPQTWSKRAVFRGMRPRPWSDPLAYLRDHAQKRTLARIVKS